MATAAPAETRPRYVYMLSKPLPLDVRIGAIGRAMHYTYWASEIIFKTAAFHAAVPHALPTMAFFMFTFTHSVPYLPGHSMIDIKIRQALKTSWMVRALGKVPGIEKATIIGRGKVGFSGPLVAHRTSTNFVFIESSAPLVKDENWPATLGEPIEYADPSRARISFRLSIDGSASEARWTSTLAGALDGEPIPREIANRWREEIAMWDAKTKERSRKDYLLGKHDRVVRVDATFTRPDGSEEPVPAFLEGSQVRKLLGMSFLQRTKDFFFKLLSDGEIHERALPLDRKHFPVQRCERLLLENTGAIE